MSIRRQLQTKGLSDSISSNIWLRFWVLTVCFWEWILLQQLFACTEWDVNLSRLPSDHVIKLGHIAIAPANMTETMVSPKTLDIQLATAGAKNSASRWNAIPPTPVRTAPTGLHHFDFDGMRQAHGVCCNNCLTALLQWMRCQSFKTSLDQMTGPPWTCLQSGQDSTDKLDMVPPICVNWLKESWHKIWFWNTGNARMILETIFFHACSLHSRTGCNYPHNSQQSLKPSKSSLI